MLYELLTGKRPFKGRNTQETLRQLISDDPAPPRTLDHSIPAELERICLKALSKRASDRYPTAAELADDLLHWQQGPQQAATELAIVPKGLRSFDADDAGFFLSLLPGPRNRDGLPETIQFWKTRLEQTDPDQTFSAGLIYGPSGCGKSSMVKAGLLPRLSKGLIAIYVEATPDDTETRIQRGLRKQLPDLPADQGLVETFALLRRREGKKVVVVLDQFEQWLHAHRSEQDTTLVSALRQCDGGHVQVIVMVRDDFAMAAARFMDAIDIPIVQGHNFATVDLFDVDHAQKVLIKFGQAFGKLPAELAKLSDQEREFVASVATGLAQDGKVVSVRLALFAEMVKGKPWIPATLQEVGGTQGIGVNYLEETFVARSANPQHRLHQQAARAVLKAMLPEAGGDIKGHMRSYAELLEASSYGSRPKEFDDLLRILDSEIRLITPTDPEGKYDADTSTVQTGEKYYQLTHDYLVPSLRDWLTRKQRETRKGRAELKLAERAGVWAAHPENRQLPSLVQWSQIRWLSKKKNWTLPQQKMMAKASRYHAVRGLVVSVVVALSAWGSYEAHGTLKAHALRDRLLDANTNEVPTIVQDIGAYRLWINSLLRDAAAQAEASKDARKQLHASLALLPVDATQVEYLYSRLLDAKPHEVPVIRDALARHKDALLDKLWAVVEAPEKGKESQRLRAAAALAKYAPESVKWTNCSHLVANDLVLENSVYLGQWSEAYRAVKKSFVIPLSQIFRDPNPERAAERTLAANILTDYAGDQPQVLADLLMDADEKQFAVIYLKFKEQGEEGLPVLTSEIVRKLLPDATDEDKEKLAKRQANAAVALLRMNQSEKVWPLLQHSPDPRARSYLIHRLSPLGADSAVIVKRLEDEPDISIRRALLLSLGEFGEKDFTPDDRKALLPKLQEIYRTASDPGLHAASEWLLRRWKQEEWLTQVNGEWAKDGEGRDKKIVGMRELVTKDKEQTPPQWYVNGQGQTMVVIPGTVEFVMGSPPTEASRQGDEPQHKKRINRTFALAAKSVTVEQYRQFKKDFKLPAEFDRTADLPVGMTSWYQAAAYCNWLSKEEGIAEEQWCYEIDGGLVVGLGILTDNVTDISPMRALAGLKSLICNGSERGKGTLADLSPLKGMPLTELSCYNTQVSDLSPLKEMLLVSLNAYSTPVPDLSSLNGMPLRFLNIGLTHVTDLSPLHGMPLEQLWMSVTFVTDLSPLKGMPLKKLHLEQTFVTDLSPLKHMPLEHLWLDFKPDRDTELLRSIKTLETINDKPATEFCEALEAYQAKAKKPLAFEAPGFDAWVKQVAALPAESQVKRSPRSCRISIRGLTGR